VLLGVRARGGERPGGAPRPTQPRARAWLEVGDDPSGWAPVVSGYRRRGGGEWAARQSWAGAAQGGAGKKGRSGWAEPCGGEGKKKKRKMAGLGCWGGKERKGERERESGRAGLGPKEEEGGKK
jgi:hypothetical protein